MEILKTTLSSKQQLAPDVWLFRFDLSQGQQLNFAAGQYLILMIGEEQRRLYSISSPVDQKDSFELLVKLLPQGVGSDYLRALEPGQRAFFQGPAGLFTLRSIDKAKVFLAAGTGLAPIRSQIHSYLNQGGQAQVFLFWGLKRKADLYLFDELRGLTSRHPNFHFVVCLDQEDKFLGLDVDLFHRGRVDRAFTEFVKERKLDQKQLNEFEYYLCSGREIVEALKIFLESLGINKENIFFDKF